MNLATFTRTLALVALLALSGCASFEREWKAEREARPARDAFAGRWDGRWTSAKHRTSSGFAGGRLRCILSRMDDRHYEAKFKANWMIFASGYTVVFETERHGPALQIRGEHDLGPIFGGIYRYTGRVTPARFSATYDSSYDRGAFELARPRE